MQSVCVWVWVWVCGCVGVWVCGVCVVCRCDEVMAGQSGLLKVLEHHSISMSLPHLSSTKIQQVLYSTATE